MTTESARAPHSEIPTGREEVAAAILEAATDLFAERGPAATSIRDIAARSKVNHGLVFRHFGTKDQLVGAVLDNLGMTLTALLARRCAGRRCAIRRWTGRCGSWPARCSTGIRPRSCKSSFPNIATLLDVGATRSTAMTSARGWRSPMALRCNSVGGCSRRSCVRPTGLDDLTEDEIREVGARPKWAGSSNPATPP